MSDTETTITLSTADGPMDAFVALPAARPAPAVVLAQEAFGVNDHIRGVCRWLAGAGYVALAPELFHRSGRGIELEYGDFTKVRPYLAGLTNAALQMDIEAALAGARAMPDVRADRVGIVGFCMGGFTAFLAACRTDVASCVSFYGGGVVHARPGIGLTPLLDEAGAIRCPILCLFGGADAGIPPEQVQTIRDRLAALGKAFDVIVYEGAAHGFNCDARASYHAEAAADARRRTLEWFARTLRA